MKKNKKSKKFVINDKSVCLIYLVILLTGCVVLGIRIYQVAF